MLLSGTPCVHKDLSITILDPVGNTLHTIPPAALAGGGFGYVYERLVGIHYEAQGFSVEYRSRLGYLDRGVDLVADRSDCRLFIQCKCSFVPFSPKKIEELLAVRRQNAARSKSNVAIWDAMRSLGVRMRRGR